MIMVMKVAKMMATIEGTCCNNWFWLVSFNFLVISVVLSISHLHCSRPAQDEDADADSDTTDHHDEHNDTDDDNHTESYTNPRQHCQTQSSMGSLLNSILFHMRAC